MMLMMFELAYYLNKYKKFDKMNYCEWKYLREDGFK